MHEKKRGADWFASWQLHWNVWLISLVNFSSECDLFSYSLLLHYSMIDDWYLKDFLFLFFCIPQTRFDSWKNDGGVDSFKTKRGIFMDRGIIRWQPTRCIDPNFCSRLNPNIPCVTQKKEIQYWLSQGQLQLLLGLANNLIVFQFTLLNKKNKECTKKNVTLFVRLSHSIWHTLWSER